MGVPDRKGQALLELQHRMQRTELPNYLAIAAHLRYRHMPGADNEIDKACREALLLAESLCNFVKVVKAPEDFPATLKEVLGAAEAMLKRTA